MPPAPVPAPADPTGQPRPVPGGGPGPRPGPLGSDLVTELRRSLDALHEGTPLSDQVPVLEGMVEQLARRLGEANG